MPVRVCVCVCVLLRLLDQQHPGGDDEGDGLPLRPKSVGFSERGLVGPEPVRRRGRPRRRRRCVGREPASYGPIHLYVLVRGGFGGPREGQPDRVGESHVVKDTVIMRAIAYIHHPLDRFFKARLTPRQEDYCLVVPGKGSVGNTVDILLLCCLETMCVWYWHPLRVEKSSSRRRPRGCAIARAIAAR